MAAERGRLEPDRGRPASDRARLIEGYLPLAHTLAGRLRHSQERHEDLVQVASLALVRAVDRRDASRAMEFPAYLIRCIEGELLRHLRDRASLIRCPRALPRLPHPAPLDEDVASDGSPPLEELGLDRALVARAARALDHRERRIVLERFYLERTQAEVAESLGLSQAHVSRLLDRALVKMRRQLARDESLFRAEPRDTLGPDERGAGGRTGPIAQRSASSSDAEDVAC